MHKFKIHGACVDLNSEGKGVVKDKENVYFINSLFPGEVCDAEIIHFSNKIGFGNVLRLEKISKDRIKSSCPIHSSCGGCVFQNYSYESQLKYKEKKVFESIKRIGQINNFKVEKISPSKEIYFYRNKLEIPLKANKKGLIESGFFKEYSHEINPIKECFTQNKKLMLIVNDCVSIFNDLKIKAYDEDRRTGILRHIILKSSLVYDEILLSIVINENELPGSKEFVKRITKLHPNIKSISLNYNLRKTNVILGNKEKIIFGPGFIRNKICDKEFNVSTSSFFQVNPYTTEDLYNFVKSLVKDSENLILCDAYCGVGTIGIILSSLFKKVIGIEINKSSYNDALKNTQLNNISNINFINGDASKEIKNISRIDTLVLDPPRKGSTSEFLNSVIKKKIKNIIYISCDPATLARDLKLLKTNYDIDLVKPFDMFPMTYHVETVVMLKRK